ncbi:AAA family ATPase [Lapidilactobacillus bayanensis]|uniref:AAA family ATPase n=1 Tax=Lapidilactobacillus bayanensis TaxID=2485998 RepID=UPI000F7B418C|nr:AAA family ATPase [Lapidilactobacillus bayanensis]
MIIWLNGPFGVGKIQVAAELQRRINGAILYDPHELGRLLTKQLPKALQEDNFEDYPEWRQWTYQLLKKMATQTQQTIIVPMAVSKQQYFDEIIGGLRHDGITVRHFTLAATPTVIAQRLRQHGNLNNRFTLSHLQRLSEQTETPQFAEILDTNELSIVEVANTIAKKCSIRIKPAITNPLLQGAVQLGTGILHQFR